jgi:GT2 family glycosyltransferase
MNQLPCSIIIPTWNAKSLIDRCLRSILAHVETGVTEIIVVDDGSTDDTASHINGEFPYVIVERHPKNMGFGVSCNDGVNRATHDIVILLNNDIIADESFLSPLLQHFSDDKVFAVNAQVFQNDGQTPGGGLVRGSLHCGLLRLRWAEYQKARDHKSLTLYANGAATAINKDKFLKLGGFDSIYAPFYSEDLDISYRAYQRGWLVYYEPASKLLHDHSVTINKDFPPDFIKIISKRNRILFIWRNIRSSWLLLQHVVWLCLRCIGAFLTLDFTYLQAVAFALTKLSTVYNRRKADPKVLRSDRQILSLTSDWEYRDIN